VRAAQIAPVGQPVLRLPGGRLQAFERNSVAGTGARRVEGRCGLQKRDHIVRLSCRNGGFGHHRFSREPQIGYILLGEQVQLFFLIHHLQGKRIRVLPDAANLTAVAQAHLDGFEAARQFPVRLKHGALKFTAATRLADARQIRTQASPLSSIHMAMAAARGAEKELLSIGCIPGHRRVRSARPERSQIGHDRPSILHGHRKRGHLRTRDAADNVVDHFGFKRSVAQSAG